jgi:toxin-antitoxin system PIN domain toxin
MPDVNILVYAHRRDEPYHRPYSLWLDKIVNGPVPFCLSVLVAVAFIRIVTNRRIYRDPTPLAAALATIDQLAHHPRCHLALPGPNHLQEVTALCRETAAVGRHVADAQHAALAIAEGCTWVTRDVDFARYAPHGLQWQHLDLAA